MYCGRGRFFVYFEIDNVVKVINGNTLFLTPDM